MWEPGAPQWSIGGLGLSGTSEVVVAVTLAQVIDIAELELTLRTPGANVAQPLRWIAVSEQVDPTPWIEPGDLVLTTGMSIRGARKECEAYVGRLVSAGATGIGFGVGLHHDDVPDALIAAGERAGLPILEVGRPVPFVAVSRAVSRLLAAEEYAESGASFDAQRKMIRSVLAGYDPSAAESPASGSAAASALPVLARHVGGFALYLDVAGGVLEASPAEASARAAQFAGEVDRLRPRGLLASASLATAQEHIVIVPVGVRETVRGFLAVGTDRPLRSADQAVLNLAVSLLSYESTSLAGRERGMSAWRALAIDLARHEGLAVGRAHTLGLTGLDPTHAAGIWLRPAPGHSIDVASVAGSRSDVILCADEAGGARGFVSHRLIDEVRSDGHHWLRDQQIRSVGISECADLTQAANVVQALDQAREAAAGAGVRLFGDLSARSIGSLIDAATARSWATSYVQTLLDAPEGAELLETVRAWLVQHGQVDAAAQRLGVHRHTVRHRLRRAETALGLSLDDPGVRADLWFALEALGPIGSPPLDTHGASVPGRG